MEPKFYFLLSWKDEFPWGYCLPDRPDVSLAVGSDDFEKQLYGSIDAKHSSRGNYGNKRKKQSALKQAAGAGLLRRDVGKSSCPWGYELSGLPSGLHRSPYKHRK